MSFAQVKGGESLRLRPRRSIGGLYPDVVVEESAEDALQITEHPVEQGAAVNDHAFKKPSTLTIRGGVSDSGPSGGTAPAVEFYEKLLELQQKREPFDIVTGKRLYKNMLLESLSVITDVNSESSLMFTAQCREVILVSLKTSSVPPRSRQGKPAKTGGVTDKGQQQPQKRKSILKGGLDW